MVFATWLYGFAMQARCSLLQRRVSDTIPRSEICMHDRLLHMHATLLNLQTVCALRVLERRLSQTALRQQLVRSHVFRVASLLAVQRSRASPGRGVQAVLLPRAW